MGCQSGTNLSAINTKLRLCRRNGRLCIIFIRKHDLGIQNYIIDLLTNCQLRPLTIQNIASSEWDGLTIVGLLGQNLFLVLFSIVFINQNQPNA